MKPERAPFLIAALILVGAAIGYLMGPVLASADETVRLAARLHREETEGLEERTLRSDAFRRTGRPISEIYDEAAALERRFRIGGALLGVWCGLAAGLRYVSLTRPRHNKEYTVNQAECVACARCFISCPREHARLNRIRSEHREDLSEESLSRE